jgi:hypothetical protein
MSHVGCFLHLHCFALRPVSSALCLHVLTARPCTSPEPAGSRAWSSTWAGFSQLDQRMHPQWTRNNRTAAAATTCQPAESEPAAGRVARKTYEARGATQNFRTEVGSSTRRHRVARRSAAERPVDGFCSGWRGSLSHLLACHCSTAGYGWGGGGVEQHTGAGSTTHHGHSSWLPNKKSLQHLYLLGTSDSDFPPFSIGCQRLARAVAPRSLDPSCGHPDGAHTLHAARSVTCPQESPWPCQGP